MAFRFRIGPFTFGRTGPRLSIWRKNSGVSIPLSGKNKRTFDNLSFGPFRYFFNSKGNKHKTNTSISKEPHKILPNYEDYEKLAIDRLSLDSGFINSLKSRGKPWRGVQERLKEELPKNLNERDDIAFNLVPKAMIKIFGEQDNEWKTEKRPAKIGNGFTTWIIVIE